MIKNRHVPCPKCGSTKVLVTDSRPSSKNTYRRRRKCECGHRWTVYEVPADFWYKIKTVMKGLKNLGFEISEKIDI